MCSARAVRFTYSVRTHWQMRPIASAPIAQFTDAREAVVAGSWRRVGLVRESAGRAFVGDGRG